jgi:hypothetical protein
MMAAHIHFWRVALRGYRFVFSCVAVCLFLGLAFENVDAQKTKVKIPDFTRGDQIPKGVDHDWNLGPTGARGWMFCEGMTSEQARQILVTEVEKGSPADGVIQVGDVILGVAGKLFSFDPRTELGGAITEAEAESGKLQMSCWRGGKELALSVPLNVIGKYARSAPFRCSKSRFIFEQGCDALAKRMKEGPVEKNGIVRSLNTLALLSSGREEFMPIIKEQIEWAAAFSDVEQKSLCCWYYGPINLLLAEYTLATGDETYKADMRRISLEIVGGQSEVGSWGHRFARPDGRLKGYGMMNAPGLPLTMSLILARKAGVSDPAIDEAIEKSVRLMRFYVGKGCVPYGDHAPWMETHDDNGKNGIAALMFNALQDREAAEYFSKMSVSSHGAEREMGHTGNFFNMLWAMPGVSLSGPNASGAWMEEFGWYYDLARRWDGTFKHQGPAQSRNDSYKNWDATGAYLLAYGQPLKKLYITGKQSGVVEAVSRSTAAKLIENGRGYSHRQKDKVFADRTEEQLFESLASWSPVVRERAAIALAKRDGDHVDRVVGLLDADLHSQLGGCQALAKLGKRAAAAVPKLEETLNSENLWLRIKAAEALAAMGPSAKSTIPQLLTLLQESVAESDPRGMQQRYLLFCLFNRRDGMLGRNLDGVDRELLYAAVRSGLGNEDGRARASLSSVYMNLTYEEIEPLLPAIYQAAVESAPSGIMFADGIRLSGLEVLAKHQIEEAMPLCIELIELDRWGSGNRIARCLNALRLYGGSAKELLPKLEPLQEYLESRKAKGGKHQQHWDLLQETIAEIESAGDAKPLRSLPHGDNS